jgi:hypothetical protein
MNLISQARSRLVIDLLVLRIGKSGRYPRRLATFFFASLCSLHKGSRTFCHVGVSWIGHLDPGRPPGLHVRTQFGNYRPPSPRDSHARLRVQSHYELFVPFCRVRSAPVYEPKRSFQKSRRPVSRLTTRCARSLASISPRLCYQSSLQGIA